MNEDEQPIIDTSLDLRADSGGRDPDSHSATLHLYHRLLWSKPLPSGDVFELTQPRPRAFLHHQSSLGEFFLASDSLVHSFKGWDLMEGVLAELADGELEAFRDLGYTIGGFTLFPGVKIDNRPTINSARGMNRRRIADRMDLTLECIRRYYRGDLRTPLGPTLARYSDFFALFDDFTGYVDFFLFQDLVNEHDGSVEYFLPFTDFTSSAIPSDVESYRTYRDGSVAFLKARNARIARWSESLGEPEPAI